MQRYMLNNSRLTSQTMASYRKLIATKHSISALVSFEAENNTEDYTYVNGSDYATYIKPQISNAATTRGSSGLNENSMLSLVGKADYTFDNKLYLGGSFRRDGSSRLSPETRWGNFWSVAGYWRLSQEDFWTNAGLKDILTDTKIRASYGENGTQPSNWFDWMGLYSLSAKYNGYAASYQSTIANDALTWERNLATNIGLDITLINRINIAFDWYNRDTKDLILSQPISSTSGFSSMLQNVGSMRNRGWEVSVNATAVETADWQVNLGLNVAQNRNTLTALNDGTTEAQFVSTSLMQRVGEAYYSFYRYEYAGVDPETGKESFYKNTTNADGSINREITTNINECQRTIVGNTEPLFTGGFNSQVSYKWFDLSFTLTYSVGGNALDMASWIQTGGGSFNYNGNVPSYFEIDKTWKNPGDIAELPVFQYGSTSQASDRWMVSTDHLRLKNLTLGFSAPKAWTDAIHLKKARLYVSGSNLLTLKSKDCYFDPEVPITGLVSFESPQLRTVTMGIEIGF